MISASDVQIVSRGDVGEKQKQHAGQAVAQVTRYVGAPVRFARVKLTLSGNPANERPAIAQAALDVNGQPVRAVATASSLDVAVEQMHERLRHQLEHLATKRIARRRRPPRSPADEWRHGDRPTDRPAYHPRPPEERRVLRHKTYALEPAIAAEAADQMTLLDYEFHLFCDADTGCDAVVERLTDGTIAIRHSCDDGHTPPPALPVPTLTVEQATDHLDLVGVDWVFFRDRGTGRGAVAYRRYDGHYGVVTAAPERS